MPAQASETKEFDKTVQHRDKFGKIIKEDHYALHVTSEGTYFERPIGSGNLFFSSGEPAGRIVKRIGMQVDQELEHVPFELPPTGAEIVSLHLQEEKEKNSLLMQEIESLKKEAARKAPAPEAKASESKAAPSKYAAQEAEKKA